MRRVMALPRALLLAATGLSLTGCMLVGLGAGAIADSRKKPPAPIPGWQVETLSRGNRLIVTTREGNVIGGEYDGVTDMPAAEYARRYAVHEAQSGSPPLPALGPGATVSSAAAANTPCELLSEAFGAALFEKAQRADLDNLDHVRAIDGVYRLKIANEMPETQYVDTMTLVVADHPAGTRVLPDFEGRAHLIEAPTSPLRAVDLQGRSVIDQVRATDEDVWISNPFRRDPENAAAVRDGVVADRCSPSPGPTAGTRFAC